MNRSTKKSTSAGRLLVASLALAGSAAWAHEPAATPETAPAAPAAQTEATSAPELSGMVVAVGKDGKLRQPTREEALAILTQRMPGLAKMGPTRIEQLPKGRKRAILGPEHLSFAMVSVGADGQLQDSCTDDPVAVLQVLDGNVEGEK